MDAMRMLRKSYKKNIITLEIVQGGATVPFLVVKVSLGMCIFLFFFFGFYVHHFYDFNLNFSVSKIKTRKNSIKFLLEAQFYGHNMV